MLVEYAMINIKLIILYLLASIDVHVYDEAASIIF